MPKRRRDRSPVAKAPEYAAEIVRQRLVMTGDTLVAAPGGLPWVLVGGRFQARVLADCYYFGNKLIVTRHGRAPYVYTLAMVADMVSGLRVTKVLCSWSVS